MYYVYPARFQPLTKLHEREMLSLVEHINKNDKGSKIIIGIVKYEPSEANNFDEMERLQPQFNPLTYWERILQIKQFITENNLEDKIQHIVPLPQPSALLNKAKYFLPPNERIICFSRAKGDLINSLMQQGERVHKIAFCESEINIISSQLIFSLITLKNNNWKNLVNEFVQDQMINVIKIETRLQTGWLSSFWTHKKAIETIEDLIEDKIVPKDKEKLKEIANLSLGELVLDDQPVEEYNAVEDVKSELGRIFDSFIEELEISKKKLESFNVGGFTKIKYDKRTESYEKIILYCRERKTKKFKMLNSYRQVSDSDFQTLKKSAEETIDSLKDISKRYQDTIQNVNEKDSENLVGILKGLEVDLKSYES